MSVRTIDGESIWLDVAIERGGKAYEGKYTIEGGTLYVLYRGDFNSSWAGPSTGRGLAMLLLDELVRGTVPSWLRQSGP